MAFDIQDLLTRGIDAYAETQVARYSANNATPNARGVTDTTAPAGQPAFSNIGTALSSPTTLLLIAAAAVAVWYVARR